MTGWTFASVDALALASRSGPPGSMPSLLRGWAVLACVGWNWCLLPFATCLVQDDASSYGTGLSSWLCASFFVSGLVPALLVLGLVRRPALEPPSRLLIALVVIVLPCIEGVSCVLGAAYFVRRSCPGVGGLRRGTCALTVLACLTCGIDFCLACCWFVGAAVLWRLGDGDGVRAAQAVPRLAGEFALNWIPSGKLYARPWGHAAREGRSVGRVAMSACPGRLKGPSGGLAQDLRSAREQGVDTIVCLVPPADLPRVTGSSADAYEQQAQQAGLRVLAGLHWRDKWIPGTPGDLRPLACAVHRILCEIKAGRNVLVHCAGGKGRTGLVLACMLIACGSSLHGALRIMRRARPGMLRNPLQLLHACSYSLSLDFNLAVRTVDAASPADCQR